MSKLRELIYQHHAEKDFLDNIFQVFFGQELLYSYLLEDSTNLDALGWEPAIVNARSDTTESPEEEVITFEEREKFFTSWVLRIPEADRQQAVNEELQILKSLYEQQTAQGLQEIFRRIDEIRALIYEVRPDYLKYIQPSDTSRSDS